MASPATGSQRHGLSYSISSPSGIAAIVVAFMAIVALVLILGPGSRPPPIVSEQPSATAAESGGPTATPSASPTATSNPTATPASTPTPLALWTGLVWSDPVTPPFTVHFSDLLAWGDGYVAVGSVEVDAARSEAAFLTSPDGLHWTITSQHDPGVDRYPRHLVALGDELFAFSHRATMEGLIVGAPPGAYYGPLIWSSTDGGVTWTRIDSQSWEDAWIDLRVGPLPDGWDDTQVPITTGLVSVTSGPDGLVAIGNSYGDGGMVPALLRSTDGWTWTEIRLPADSPSALLHDVAGFAGGYALVGSVNAGPQAATATPAAWFSPDGETWTRSTVNVDEELYPDGIEGIGDFVRVATGADGLLGWYGYREMAIGGPTQWEEWSSVDGQTWVPLEHRADPSGFGPVASDGVRMVALPSTFHEDTGQLSPIDRAWVSTDGMTWSALTMSRSMSDPMEGFWVVPDGVIYAGVQSFWFATAVVAD